MRILFTFFLTAFAVLASAQEIALTFDDAPTSDGPVFNGAERTELILKQLKEANVTEAAFFVITNQLNEKGKARIKRYADAGHAIANHTHRHAWIHEVGTSAYCRDIRTADSILRQYKTFKPWFRYPFLNEGSTKSTRDSIRQTLAELKLVNGYVTIDNYDWYINTLYRKAVAAGKTVDEKALLDLYLDHIWTSIRFYDDIGKRVLGRSPKHVLLLHETDITAKFLKPLIDFLRSKGCRIISPTEAYTDPIATTIPDVLFNNQGRIGAIARSQGIPGRELVQESEDEEYLDKLVEQKKVFR